MGGIPSNTPQSGDADLDGRLLAPAMRWLALHHGTEAVQAAAREAGVSTEALSGRSSWISVSAFESLLASVRARVGTDEDFARACTHEFQRTVGVFRYMVWALTPEALFSASVLSSSSAVRSGRFETVSSGPGRFVLRYVANGPESRLMCVSRQAQWKMAPTLWSLDPARVTERGCVALGDPCCEYELRWSITKRPLLIVLGAMVGIVIGIGVGLAATEALRDPGVTAIERVLLFGLVGASVALGLEQRRVLRVNAEFSAEGAELLRRSAQDGAEARAEIVALNVRQREWTKLLEEQLSERSAAVERVAATLSTLNQSRATTMRAFSHDLRNPLFVLKGNLSMLEDTEISEPERRESLDACGDAIDRIDTLLLDLMDAVATEAKVNPRAPTRVEVAPLADTYARRLRALVFGRDVRVAALNTREAPDAIQIDPLVLDRVVDNLLTNAAKYTDRGSIVLEFGGAPGFFVLKLSDTGRGIEEAAIATIFRPRIDQPRTRFSQGFGLSGVVQLLAGLGGRLEVMSRPARGTTFWAFFPVAPPSAPPPELPSGPEDGRELADRLIDQVVTIRKVRA